MTEDWRERLEESTQDGGNNNGKRNGLSRYALWLSVIISSAVVGGYIFDWVGNLIRKDIKLEQHTELIGQLTRQLTELEKENGNQEVDNKQFRSDILKTIDDMKKALESMQQMVYKLDKKMLIIESIDLNVKKLTDEN